MGVDGKIERKGSGRHGMEGRTNKINREGRKGQARAGQGGGTHSGDTGRVWLWLRCLPLNCVVQCVCGLSALTGSCHV